MPPYTGCARIRSPDTGLHFLSWGDEYTANIPFHDTNHLIEFAQQFFRLVHINVPPFAFTSTRDPILLSIRLSDVRGELNLYKTGAQYGPSSFFSSTEMSHNYQSSFQYGYQTTSYSDAINSQHAPYIEAVTQQHDTNYPFGMITAQSAGSYPHVQPVTQEFATSQGAASPYGENNIYPVPQFRQLQHNYYTAASTPSMDQGRNPQTFV
ncbi:uncharacterized protein FIBRA_06921 [Fibroporia radiculosa]|uniref:Uncharacterized protein n=1 Tax=Fibroporia radiculosa TaxID=599839 RepID=J4GCW4_9APHY|nr:uncharacterized protein FIBRA_06921 [Fibroporia radiculosa]CCM04733.1 predicted protein [Fibroporia radiculosa]